MSHQLPENRLSIAHLAPWLCRWLCGLGVVVWGGDRSFGEPIDFERQIRPLLAEHCLACHGVDQQTREGGLRLDQREAALLGGDSGQAAIVAGRAEASEVWRRITTPDDDQVMPPSWHASRLTSDDVELIGRWIDQGAVFAEHWAFVPPRQVELPQATLSAESPHPIDALVEAQLRQHALTLAPPEAPAVLCRRLYLDLIGLPPSPAELAEYERDGFEATVDKLLASERFGEKWARPWLDVARYSDTNGYEKDLRREQWAWRDWVIRALNSDLPYDQFIIEQIAGDLLPEATQDQRIATGFRATA